MNVNDMIAAMRGSKTVDAMVNIEPYNAIAEADGIAHHHHEPARHPTTVPVFMAATPDFVEKHPDAVVAYLQAWLDVAQGLQGQPEEGVRRDLRVLHVEGLRDVARYRSPRRWAASTSRQASRRGLERLHDSITPSIAPDREGRLAAGSSNADRLGASHRTDGDDVDGYNPRIRNAAGMTDESTEETHDKEMTD